jgi:SnoaL-like domain
MTLLLLLAHLVTAAGPEKTGEVPAVAQKFLERFQAMQQAKATEADVDRLLELCTDDVAYEHARVGAVVRGKPQLRAGFVGHLGEVRGDKTRVVRWAHGPKFIALEVQRDFEVKDGVTWKPVHRAQLLILEHDQAGLIHRVFDDW